MSFTATVLRNTAQGVLKQPCSRTVGRFGCTIRAYAAHAKELGNAVLEDVSFFNKPGVCGVQVVDGGVLPIPTHLGELHHEIELCVLIGQRPLPDPVRGVFDPKALKASVLGLGLGLDWTLRATQQLLAKGGLPWERAKAFSSSAAVTDFAEVGVPGGHCIHPDAAEFPTYEIELRRNGSVVQRGDTSQLLWDPLRQMWEMHRVAPLRHGDIVMTGTPPGVASVQVGDRLRLACPQLGLQCSVTLVPESHSHM